MKSQTKTVNATVQEVLPNDRYRVVLPQGDTVYAHVSGDMRMHRIRLLPGDTVQVEVSPFDRTKARITYSPPTEQ